MKSKLIALFCSMLVSQQSLAAQAVCVGPISQITQSNGKVIIFVGAGSQIGINICSLDTTMNLTTPAQCKSYLNQIYLAYALQKTVDLWIMNAPTTSCSSITNWFAADVQIIQMY